MQVAIRTVEHGIRTATQMTLEWLLNNASAFRTVEHGIRTTAQMTFEWLLNNASGHPHRRTWHPHHSTDDT